MTDTEKLEFTVNLNHKSLTQKCYKKILAHITIQMDKQQYIQPCFWHLSGRLLRICFMFITGTFEVIALCQQFYVNSGFQLKSKSYLKSPVEIKFVHVLRLTNPCKKQNNTDINKNVRIYSTSSGYQILLQPCHTMTVQRSHANL